MIGELRELLRGHERPVYVAHGLSLTLGSGLDNGDPIHLDA